MTMCSLTADVRLLVTQMTKLSTNGKCSLLKSDPVSIPFQLLANHLMGSNPVKLLSSFLPKLRLILYLLPSLITITHFFPFKMNSLQLPYLFHRLYRPILYNLFHYLSTFCPQNSMLMWNMTLQSLFPLFIQNFYKHPRWNSFYMILTRVNLTKIRNSHFYPNDHSLKFEDEWKAF